MTAGVCWHTPEMEISGSFGDSVVSCDIFLETVLDVFAEAGMWEDVFTKNRHLVFFWKHAGKRACFARKNS